MKRGLFTCDYCKEDIGFVIENKEPRYAEIKYPDGIRRMMCENCFEKIMPALQERSNVFVRLYEQGKIKI